MSESIPKEIIGIAYASEWNHIKQFIKALLEMTLNSEEEYSLIVLNAFINNKRYEEYDVQIKSKAQIKLLSSITNFEKISLYQNSEYRRNIINVSKNKNVIVLTAQYMGPEIDHTNYFDFAIYLDSFDLPYFSDNKGNLFECYEIIEIMRRFKPKGPEKVKKPKPSKKLENFKTEVGTYEKITTRKAIWGGSETRAFQKWKMRVQKEFREKTGGFPFYKGKITKKYDLYLNNLIKKSISKQAPPKKSKARKPTVKKSTVKKSTVKKPTVKKPTVKKPTVKKPIVKKSIVKKSTVKKPITKNLAAKQKSTAKKLKSLNFETKIYKKLTGKNAIWGGSETKAFQKWKLSVLKEFREKIGGKPYYKGKTTKNYELYLKSY